MISLREQRTKDDVRLYPNGTISYREARNFSFDRSRSSDDETFQFKTINVVYMVSVFSSLWTFHESLRLSDIDQFLTIIESAEFFSKDHCWTSFSNGKFSDAKDSERISLGLRRSVTISIETTSPLSRSGFSNFRLRHRGKTSIDSFSLIID